MVSSIFSRDSRLQDSGFSLSPLWLDRGQIPGGEAISVARTVALTSAPDEPAADASLSELMVVNNAPVIDFAPIYASDFENPDDATWHNYTFGDDLPDDVGVEDDGTGNDTLVSEGPWWTDPNHTAPGAGALHLLSIIYVDGTHDGILIDDFRDVTFSFDIRAEQLVIPDGAHIYLWFQGTDPTLAWGEGQYVNYANTSVKVDELLVANGWAHVSITMTQEEADWLALGSNPDREGTYSISDSIVSALSGNAIDFGLIMLLGNGTPATQASGTILIDNVEITHGDILRVKYDADALAAGLQPLNLAVNISDPDVTTFEGFTITVDYDGGGLAGETLAFAFAPGSGLSESGGALFLDAVQIGTVTGGTGGAGLVIGITAAIEAAVLDALVGSLAYRNLGAVDGQVRELLVEVDDGQGGTASFAAEIIARLPLDDGSGDDHLLGTGANEVLNGGPGSDWLEGAGGDDRLDGGAGIDTTAGGTGNDWHYVDDAADIVVEGVGEGTSDRIFAAVDYVLKSGVEVEILSTVFNPATTPINLTGNSSNNTIFGNAGANRLNGGGGNDSLVGLEGNDILDGGAGVDYSLGGTGDDWHYVDNAADVVAETAGEGTLDRLFAAVSYTLAAGAEVEIITTTNHIGTAAINLTGNAFANLIYGNAGDNVLTGGGGADTLVGWAGNDWFYVDNAGDIVVEGAGGGTLDRIFASVDYTLRAGVQVELLTTDFNPGTSPINLTGNELDNAVYGNAGANRLNGAAGSDTLIGFEGNDILDGGTGADTAVGGTGDDWFYVDNASDVVSEAAGQGTLDRLFASVSYTLTAGAEIEVMSTTNHGATTAINLTGNALANRIYGNAGDNVLTGGGGADTLTGWAGNDWYYVDNAGDVVMEAAGQGTLDRVFASASWTLTAGAEIEIMSTDSHAGTAAIDLTGNALANTIYGNDGANILDGKGGSDTLIGRAGGDTFAFTSALGATNVDLLVDYVSGSDRIALDDAVFTQVGGPGALNASAFAVGAAAVDADDRIVYNNATGQLFYDADGSGAGAAIHFATLQGALTLAASDFLVI